MKKKLITLLLFSAMVISLLTGCQSGKDETTTPSASSTMPSTTENANSNTDNTSGEMPLVRLAATPFSGNVLVGIAQDKGFFADEGIEVELQLIVGSADSQAALAAGHVDVLTTYGTAPALSSIAAGTDITIFAGYMLQGCMPILAKEGTVWNGVEDLVGKKVIGDVTSRFILGYALKELGYDPDTDVEWIPYVDDNTNMELTRKGEVDYMRGTTGLHTRAKELGLDAVAFCGDVLPEYSCCRIWSNTNWLNENRDVAVKLIKALLRAQAVLESDPDYAVEIVVEQTDLTKEYAEGFIKNEHLMIRLDPHWKAVSRQMEGCVELGLLEGDTSLETLKAHFTPYVYKEALDACVAEYYDESPEFYDYYLQFYEDSNSAYDS